MNFDWESLHTNLEVQDGLTPANAAAAIHDFKDYLAQQMWNPESATSPSKLADKAWHRLILDSSAYGKLQTQVLGFPMNHIPTIARDHSRAEPFGEHKDDCGYNDVKSAKKDDCGGCISDGCTDDVRQNREVKQKENCTQCYAGSCSSCGGGF